MAPFPLSAAPTALLSRNKAELTRLFRQAVLVVVDSSGKTEYKIRGKTLFVQDVEFCRATLIEHRSRPAETKTIIFAFRDEHDVVTASLNMSTGSAEISQEHDGVTVRTDVISISSVLEVEPNSRPHHFMITALDSLFTVATVYLRNTIVNSNWTFQIKGVPIEGGRPRIMPREILAVESTANDAIAAEVDWNRSIIRLNDNNIWQDVKISFGINSGLTAKQSRERRIASAVKGLLAMIRADPKRPQPKTTCKAKLKVSIDSLGEREFDQAWTTACAEGRRSNPSSRWGLPGRPMR